MEEMPLEFYQNKLELNGFEIRCPIQPLSFFRIPLNLKLKTTHLYFERGKIVHNRNG